MNDTPPTAPVLAVAGKRSTNSGAIQSIDRALSILELLARNKPDQSLSELSEKIGLNAATCHHILKTLVARKYVRPGGARGRYALGPQVLVLADAIELKSDLLRLAEPVLQELNELTQEAVHLAVLQDDELVTLAKREALHALRIDAGSIGKSVAYHATATGKALLAGLTDEEVKALLTAKGMKRFTEKTVTDLDAIIAELALVREQGFSTDVEEYQRYVVCVGAPIRDQKGEVIASVSVSAPTVRADEQHIALMRQQVTEAARSLSLAPASKE